ncbi:MAG: hypothetical protein ACI86X_002059 [Moritella sp.]|jgi:hypothetical protein
MITQSVCSDNGDREGKWIGLLICMLIILAALLLPFHQVAPVQQQLAPHQVSVKDLAPVELAMIADLRLAHEEIRNLHQDSVEFDGKDSWANIAELKAMWLAPFVEDKSWARKGKHAWLKIAAASYQGTPAIATGAVAAILNSNQSTPDIWLDLNNTGLTFTTPINADSTVSANSPDQRLIQAGWLQVVFADQHEE